MTKLQRLSVVGLVISVAVARAETTSKVIGEGLELAVKNHELVVRKSKAWAPLGEEASSLLDVQIDKKRRAVTVKINDNSCDPDVTLTYTFDHLLARLENTAAYLLHVKHDYKAAIAGYTRAIALDPTWEIPALNLAGASTSAGDRDFAIKAVAPHLSSDPVGTYIAVASDPELVPLLERPELHAIEAKPPGTVKKGLGLLYSKDKQLLAMLSSQSYAWMSCSTRSTVDLVEPATGKIVHQLVLEDFGDNPDHRGDQPKACATSSATRARIAARTERATATLVALGFSEPTVDGGDNPTPSDDGDKIKIHFDGGKLGMVLVNGSFNLLRGNQIVGSGSIDRKFEGASYLPELDTVIVDSSHPEPECGHYKRPLASSVVIKLKPVAKKP